MKTMITPHFSIEEFIFSDYAQRQGIDNTPDIRLTVNMLETAKLMEEIRAWLGVPIHLTSGYRCPALNVAIGGSWASQHLTCNATDFVAWKYGTPYEVAKAISESDIAYDQLIYEGKWVHVSRASKNPPRRMNLTAEFKDGERIYKPGILL